MKRKTTISLICSCLILAVATLSCVTKRPVRAARERVAAGSNIAVFFNGPENIKNVVASRFMLKGYKVRAFNVSDMYSTDDIFDVRDLKTISHVVSIRGGDEAVPAITRASDNIYKMHVYNFEVNKAEALIEVKRKFNANYLVVLDLKDWQDVSWGRAINLENLELIWVENYPSKYNDDLVTVVDHLIGSMSGG